MVSVPPQAPALAQRIRQAAHCSLLPPGRTLSPSHEGASLLPTPSCFPLLPEVPHFRKWSQWKPHLSQSETRWRELGKKQVGSTCRQIWGGDDSSEGGLVGDLLERGGKVGEVRRNGETRPDRIRAANSINSNKQRQVGCKH